MFLFVIDIYSKYAWVVFWNINDGEIHIYIYTYILLQYSDTSEFVNRDDLASSKSDVDKLDLDKLKIIPTDLNKQGNAVENEVVKKTLYDKLLVN